MKKRFIVTLLMVVMALTSCGQMGDSTENSESSLGRDTESNTNVDLDTEYDEAWAGDNIVVQDLGTMKLESYPVDMNYDWRFSVMKEDGIYKMWWTRQYKSDTIWYAESTDLVNWTNEQMVLYLPKDTFYDREWVKLHVACPSVVKVGGTYYMYFEAPATLMDTGECDNNVFLATSSDGINFTMYPNNEDPQPIIHMPKEYMVQRKYGVGQPSVCYVNGAFYMWYTDSVNTSGMRFATSTDGINFGNYEEHQIVFDRHASGVKYNEILGKFVMAYETNPKEWGNSETSNSNIYLNFSSDGINWDIKSMKEENEANRVSSDNILTRGYPEFVTNEHGVITTETMYVTYMEAGRQAEPGEDFRYTAPTWDGHVTAVNLKEYENKPIVLPNGTTISKENLEVYSNKWETYETAMAVVSKGTPTIDGDKEAAWQDTPILEVNRLTGIDGSIKTNTSGEIRFLWDEEAAYFYGIIVDEDISYSNSKIEQRDTVTIFINVANSQKKYKAGWNVLTQDWTEGTIAVSVCVDGTYRVVGPNKKDITNEFENLVLETEKTSEGWKFEVKIPWHPAVIDKVKADRIIGFEAQINDAVSPGYRKAMILWNDLRADAFDNLNCLGQVKLAE